MSAPAPRDAGVTLVELIVALAIFALISLAGFTLVDSVLRIRERTDGRLERLAAMQRTLQVLTADLEQVGGGPVILVDEALIFRRAASTPDQADVVVRYDTGDQTLRRSVGQVGARPQTLLTGVEAVRWRFFTPDLGWTDDPPAPLDGVERRPAAIEAELQVRSERGGPGGRLRRVVALPALR